MSGERCIGRGYEGDGCGLTGGGSGDTCPECGGMILSAETLEEAEQLAERWRREDGHGR